ncbi:hypothetical protein HYU19_03755, partial [Candidatus Woesearchaeota archaeon]|nr:hypothetical protein [Candidatus Woesearchaeota archaeon]
MAHDEKKDTRKKNTMKAAVMSLGSVSSQWTVDAMKKHFDIVDSINIKNVEVNLCGKNSVVLYSGKALKQYDCIYLKGSFRYVSLLHSIATCLDKKAYQPLLPSSFILGHDKLLSQLILQKANVPMPTTYIASLETSKAI